MTANLSVLLPDEAVTKPFAEGLASFLAETVERELRTGFLADIAYEFIRGWEDAAARQPFDKELTGIRPDVIDNVTLYSRYKAYLKGFAEHDKHVR